MTCEDLKSDHNFENFKVQLKKILIGNSLRRSGGSFRLEAVTRYK